MTTYRTGNPIGSTDPKDLYDNAENTDVWVNSLEREYWDDRFGRNRKTVHGMEKEFDTDQVTREKEFVVSQASRQDRFNDFIASSGYSFLGDYAAGIEITEYNQVLRDSNGEFWRLSGNVELPYTTTGDGLPEDGSFEPIGDAVLRQELNNPGQGAALIGRGVLAVDSIADLLALPQGQRKEGLRYLVKGYYAGSDVGGGEFYYDPSRSDENDYGLVLDGFIRVISTSSFDLEMFGAKGDGLSNDAPYIQMAIDSIALLGGGVLLGKSSSTYGVKESIRIKSNISLSGGILKKIGDDKDLKILQNYSYGLPSEEDTNIEIKNITLIGTGDTVGVSDQGSGIGLFGVNGVLIENVSTNNTNGDGIQWRNAHNLTIRDVTIGNYGRNGISPTSGLNTVWDNVKVVGSPITGANPGKDIDAETNSENERGTHLANNIRCRDLTLVDFYTEDGGDFSQEWIFNNCIIGPAFNALNIKSTNRTNTKNIIINSNCVISAGQTGNAVRIENVSGVLLNGPTFFADNSPAPSVGIVGEVNALNMIGVRQSGFTRGIQSFGTARLNNSLIENTRLDGVYLSGSNNTFKGCIVGDLTVNGEDSVDNIFDETSHLSSFSGVNGADLMRQHFGSIRGTQTKSLFSIDRRLPDGSSYDLFVPIPNPESGRLLTIIAGYSHRGNPGHWASLITTIRVGSAGAEVAHEISKSSDGTRDISVTSVFEDVVILTLSYQYAGMFSATVIG